MYVWNSNTGIKLGFHCLFYYGIFHGIISVLEITYHPIHRDFQKLKFWVDLVCETISKRTFPENKWSRVNCKALKIEIGIFELSFDTLERDWSLRIFLFLFTQQDGWWFWWFIPHIHVFVKLAKILQAESFMQTKLQNTTCSRRRSNFYSTRYSFIIILDKN